MTKSGELGAKKWCVCILRQGDCSREVLLDSVASNDCARVASFPAVQTRLADIFGKVMNMHRRKGGERFTNAPCHKLCGVC